MLVLDGEYHNNLNTLMRYFNHQDAIHRRNRQKYSWAKADLTLQLFKVNQPGGPEYRICVKKDKPILKR